MEDTYTITKDKILHTAKNNGQTVSELLKMLFPDAFKTVPKKKKIDLKELAMNNDNKLFSPSQFKKAGLPENCIQVRSGGKYDSIGFYLNTSNVDWKLVAEDSYTAVLIPTVKELPY